MRRASRRRKPLPGPLEAAVTEIEQAQRALLAAVPRPRDDGVPLGVGLAAFSLRLRGALDALEAWDDPAAREIEAAVGAAMEEAASLRLRPGTLSFADLNEAIAEVLAPLEDVAEIERRFR